jgi:hypothetical protein
MVKITTGSLRLMVVPPLALTDGFKLLAFLPDTILCFLNQA